MAIGSVAGIVTAKALESMLYSVKTTDARVIAGTVAALFLTALAASLIPARRAARTDPAKTLTS